MKKKLTQKLLLSLTVLGAYFMNAQSVEGTVTNSGLPLAGVNVIVKGTSKGAVTDFDGTYKINSISTDDILVFSYIGYIEKEVSVNGQSVINVSLEEDISALDEVVVVGYTTQKKALITGANLNVKGETVRELRTTTPMEALQGIAPGVSVSRNNGAPGSGTRIRIRGIGTIGDSNPLYIVDGVPVGNNIDYLNSSDIESIDVLKDAATAAIYGARAANGVVLVTTVKGKKGQKPRITYDGFYGLQNIYKNLKPLNAQEYIAIIDEGRFNDGLPSYDWQNLLLQNNWLNANFPDQLGTALGEEVWRNIQNGWQGTNWIDEITKEDAAMRSHALNITGAKEDANYSFGVSYLEQEGIIGGNVTNAGFTRLTARMNTEFVLFKKDGRNLITLGETLTYTNRENRTVRTAGIYWNDLRNALVANPLQPAYWQQSLDYNIDPYGFAPGLDFFGSASPLADMFYTNNFMNLGNKNNTIVGNVYAIAEPIEGLKIKGSYGFNTSFGHGRSYGPVFALGERYQSLTDGVAQFQFQNMFETWVGTITYDTNFGDHSLTALLGTEKRKSILGTNVRASNGPTFFGNPEQAYLDNTEKTLLNLINASGQDFTAGGGGGLSYFGRVGYNYKEKYLFDATLRADASQNFAPENRWGYFPSASAGWVLSQEDFMQNISNVVNFAKLRVSWGQNGNDRIPNFIYTSRIDNISPGYFFGPDKGVSATTAVLANVPNRGIKWETSEQANIGIDARFFNSKLTLVADWYKKTTKDWLVQAPALGTAGAPAPFINGGDVENTGYEFSLGWQDNSHDFKYGATISGAFNKNEIVRIANTEGIIDGEPNALSQSTSLVSRAQVGQPIGFFYGYKTTGILQNQDEVEAYVVPDTDINGNPNANAGEFYFPDQRPGDVRFVDTNQDGVIDVDDKQYLGNPIPDFELGIQLNAEYKGFYTNVTLAGKFGMQVMQSYRMWGSNIFDNFTVDVFNRWHGEGTSTKWPRLSATPHRNTIEISDIYMHDADFLRINNLTFGYKLGNILPVNSFITDGKIYVAVNNLYTFTNYSGMDPDVSHGGPAPPGDPDNILDWGSGLDLGLYPSPRTVIFGLNLNF
ncbi:TonB-dependent receptor [Flavobacteriaceae bacterium MHTCC 0001]